MSEHVVAALAFRGKALHRLVSLPGGHMIDGAGFPRRPVRLIQHL